MKTLKINHNHPGKAIAAAVLTTLLIAGCASTPHSPPGAADARARLTSLQSDPDLARHAPIEIREAETAVRLAEIPVPKDQALGIHRVYLADHKVEIAEAKASTRHSEDQRSRLRDERDQARLDARTREAEKARREAELARNDANRARSEADAARVSEANAATAAARRTELARNEAERAREAAAADAAHRSELAKNEADRKLALAASEAARESAELQRQIELLQAETTDRGLVLTLGNVLFETGRADLKSTATDSLNRLVAFLNQYQDRTVVIEGHTDNVGTDATNQILSQHRADSVKSYLLKQGIGSQRLTASGMGESHPIANNDTASGRQENRRVEVIIGHPILVTAGTPIDK